MLKPLVIGIILLLIVGVIATFIIWGDDIKIKINEWQNKRSDTTVTTDTKVVETDDNSTANTDTEDTAKVEEKVNVTNYNIYKLSQENGCEVEFNTAEASEFVNYEGYEMSVDLPYNEKWGNEKFSVLPFEVGNDEVVFGKLIQLNDCRWAREYVLEIIDKRSVTKAQDAYYNDGISQDMMKTYRLSGYTIIRTVNFGSCDQLAYEVIGPKYNYVFKAVCSSDIEADTEILESAVNSLTFGNLMLGMK